MKTLTLTLSLLCGIVSAEWLDLSTMTVCPAPTNSNMSQWAMVTGPNQPVPEGYGYITNAWDIAGGIAVPIISTYPAPRFTAAPVLFQYGIESPVLVLQSQTNGTPAYGIVATTNGDLVTYIDHASPRPSQEEINQRVATAISNREAKVAKAKADMNGQLQVRLENLERLLGIRP